MYATRQSKSLRFDALADIGTTPPASRLDGNDDRLGVSWECLLTTTDPNDAQAYLKLLAGKRILIVEDEYFIADETRKALQAAGAHVVGPAPSVNIGMAMIDDEKIDAAILDIRLEGETVFPIADRLHNESIPFVFATSYINANIPEKFGGYHLCEKPTALAEIAAALFSASSKLQ